MTLRTAPRAFAQPLSAAAALICLLALPIFAHAQTTPSQAESPTVIAFIDGVGVEAPASSVTNSAHLEDRGQRICFVDTSAGAGPVTPIEFTIDQTEELLVEVFNPEGKVVETVASGVWNKGSHVLGWFQTDAEGRNVEDGVYVIRLRTAADSGGIAFGTDSAFAGPPARR